MLIKRFLVNKKRLYQLKAMQAGLKAGYTQLHHGHAFFRALRNPKRNLRFPGVQRYVKTLTHVRGKYIISSALTKNLKMGIIILQGEVLKISTP